MLFVGIGLMVFKFLVWWIINFNVILIDVLESIINVVVVSFGLYSIWFFVMLWDENYFYGYGKIEFIFVGFEGVLILFVGLSIMGKVGYDLFYL